MDPKQKVVASITIVILATLRIVSRTVLLVAAVVAGVWGLLDATTNTPGLLNLSVAVIGAAIVLRWVIGKIRRN